MTGDDAARGGGDLRDIVETARKVTSVLKGLHSRYPRFIIEQAAIAGVLNPKFLKDAKQAQDAAAYIAKRLDALAEETEQGWHGEALPEGGMRFWRELRGVMESHLIDGPFIASADALKLDQYAAHLQEVYAKAATLKRKDTTLAVHGPTDLLDAVMETGPQGALAATLQGPRRDEPQSAVGDHARPRHAHHPPGEDQGGRGRRRCVLAADGRRGRATGASSSRKTRCKSPIWTSKRSLRLIP